MPTFLFNEIIFGPIKSRRLGVSLGINLLPVNGKVCSFDCLYCECGLNKDNKGGSLPDRAEVKEALERKLRQMKQEGIVPDVITFAGNGEPTLHPSFSQVIDDTLALRDTWFPTAKICVLSNSTQLHKPEVVEALRRIDQPILKLDSAFDETIRRMDRPISSQFSVSTLVNQLKTVGRSLIIQTLFTRGEHEGETFDNTTPAEVQSWIDILKDIHPASVMIYTIDRDTPIKSMEKIPLSELRHIAEMVKTQTHLPVSIAG
jgi:wyosine [tRNA(Phe)-imidazoG37] synthetase (radical SAM superfamily)